MLMYGYLYVDIAFVKVPYIIDNNSSIGHSN
jgi:hypothetical protein